MKTCSFLGHIHIYDRDLPEAVTNALLQILNQENDLRFLFYDPYNDFTLLCLNTAARLRLEYPHKPVETVLIGNNADFPRRHDRISSGAIDRILVPPVFAAGKKNGPVSDKKYLRFMIRQSNFLLSYVYPGLFDTISREYEFARERHIETVDLIRDDTSQFMDVCLKDLTETEKVILQKLRNKEPLPQIAADCHFSKSAVVYYQRKFRREISLLAQQRLRQQQ